MGKPDTGGDERRRLVGYFEDPAKLWLALMDFSCMMKER